MITSIDELVNLVNIAGEEERERFRMEKIAASVVQEVALHADEYLRIVVVVNKSVTPEELSLFGNDSSSRVRGWLAMRRATPAETLKKLAIDEDLTVRHQVALNKKCPLEVLSILADDDLEMVRSAARTAIASRHAG